MSRGPPPTPTAILEMRGSKMGKYRARKEPKGDGNPPSCPRRLTKEERAVWKKLIPQLVKLGVVEEIDGSQLSRYCEMSVRWNTLTEWVKKNGEVYVVKGADGRPRYSAQWPQVTILRSLSEQLRRIEAEFGMSPAGRARLAVESQSTKEDAFESFQAKKLRIAE